MVASQPVAESWQHLACFASEIRQLSMHDLHECRGRAISICSGGL